MLETCTQGTCIQGTCTQGTCTQETCTQETCLSRNSANVSPPMSFRAQNAAITMIITKIMIDLISSLFCFSSMLNQCKIINHYKSIWIFIKLI